MTDKKIDILGKTLNDLSLIFSERYGKGLYHAEALYKEVFQKGKIDFKNNPSFEKSAKLASILEDDVEIRIPEIIKTEDSEDGAFKFASRFDDGAVVESVIIPMNTYNTICVSSQAGCRMGCRFCETGNLGLTRNLSASEIVSQVYNARFRLAKSIKNIVFMGMGEPLDNFDNVAQALLVLNEQKGLNFAFSRITVSTAGLPDGIKKLGNLGHRRLHVAISLNAPDNRTRSWLMPVNNHAPLEKLRKALLEYPLRPGGCFLVEYIVIPGINNLPEHAEAVAAFIGDIPARINLIPCNPSSSCEFTAATDDDIHEFTELLSAKGLFVRKRWSKGSIVAAGCGQLGAELKNITD